MRRMRPGRYAPPALTVKEVPVQRLAAAMLAIVGVIHLLALPGVLGPAHLAQLYGLPGAAVADPNPAILLQHRAVLFGVLGGFLVYAVFDPALQRPALVAAGLSAGTFVGIARSVGGYNAAVGRVVHADLVALACLAVVAGAHLLHARVTRGGRWGRHYTAPEPCTRRAPAPPPASPRALTA